jgi:hypothetical protein
MKNIACAVLAGSISSAIATPTDVLKVKQHLRDQTNLTEKNRGISTVGNHKKTVGFFRLGKVRLG